MIKIMFVCHGNICRSPMAEMVFKDMVRKAHLEHRFLINSTATSREEIGNGVHHGTRRKLAEEGIPCEPHRAVQMTRTDYKEYDYLIGMDHWNLQNILRSVGSDPEGKVHLLLDFTDEPGDIADPWYTGNFDLTYKDVTKGCKALLDKFKNE